MEVSHCKRLRLLGYGTNAESDYYTPLSHSRLLVYCNAFSDYAAAGILVLRVVYYFWI